MAVETAAEKVARIRAELELKRNGTAPAAAAPPPAEPVAATPPPAAPPPVAAVVEPMPAIAGLTQQVWDLMTPATRAAVLAAVPAPAAAPAAAPAPTLFDQQTAPINPPDMLGGTSAPAPAAAPEPLPTPEPAKRTRKAKAEPEAAPTAPADPIAERIAAALEEIVTWLEFIATK